MSNPSPDWWRTWFGPGYVALYDGHLRQRTTLEVDQLEALLEIHPPLRILDLPCGQGRHSIELARRGYHVTGADLSPFMLSLARDRARDAGVTPRFVLADMREPLDRQRFDVVLNLFTSFGYFADQADDLRVVSAAASMLDAGGRFVLEVVNGERVMRNFQEREWFTVGDAAVLERRSLDRASRRMTVERTVDRDGVEEVSVHVVRLYGPLETSSLLAEAGFAAVDLYGDWDGSPASAESMRLLAVARKK